MSNARRIRFAPRAALLLIMVAGLAACGSMMGKLPEKLGGLPESAPQRPAETMPYPNVYEVRPTREAKPLTDDEQKKLESELATLRENQKQRAIEPPPPPPPPAKTAAPAKKAPAKETLKAEAPAKKKQNEAIVPEQKAVPPKLIN